MVPRSAFMWLVLSVLCMWIWCRLMDKELSRLYNYVLSLDSDMVRMMVDIENRYAHVSNMQSPPQTKLPELG